MAEIDYGPVEDLKRLVERAEQTWQRLSPRPQPAVRCWPWQHDWGRWEIEPHAAYSTRHRLCQRCGARREQWLG